MRVLAAVARRCTMRRERDIARSSKLPSRLRAVVVLGCSVNSCTAQHGADANVRNNWLESPLHAAAYGGRDDLIALLLAAGADPLLQTEHGKTALDFAQVLHSIAHVTILR